MRPVKAAICLMTMALAMALPSSALAHSDPFDISTRFRVLDHEHIEDRTIRHQHAGEWEWHQHHGIAQYRTTKIQKRQCRERTYRCYTSNSDSDYTAWSPANGRDDDTIRLDERSANSRAFLAAHTAGGVHTHDGLTGSPYGIEDYRLSSSPEGVLMTWTAPAGKPGFREDRRVTRVLAAVSHRK